MGIVKQILGELNQVLKTSFGEQWNVKLFSKKTCLEKTIDVIGHVFRKRSEHPSMNAKKWSKERVCAEGICGLP